MSQRISLLIHDLKLCQKSEQINNFRKLLGEDVTAAGSQEFTSEFFKASLAIICYSATKRLWMLQPPCCGWWIHSITEVFCRAKSWTCTSITRVPQYTITLEHKFYLSQQEYCYSQMFYICGGYLNCWMLFWCFCVFRSVCACVCVCVCEFTLLHLFLFYKTMSRLIGGSLHPAAYEHGVEAPGNWFKDKMKWNVKNESKISAYSLRQGVVISNANQRKHARRKRISLPLVVLPHLMQSLGHEDQCHDVLVCGWLSLLWTFCARDVCTYGFSGIHYLFIFLSFTDLKSDIVSGWKPEPNIKLRQKWHYIDMCLIALLL